MTAKGVVPKRRKRQIPSSDFSDESAPKRRKRGGNVQEGKDAVVIDLLGPKYSHMVNIERPNQVKLTLSDEEKACLDILRLAKGLTTSDFLRQQIRDAYLAHQRLLAHRQNGTAPHAKPR